MTNTEGQLPSISWAELQTVLLSLADTPVKQMMVNHLVSGTRKQAAFLSPESIFREILHIGAALLRQAIADGRRNGQLTHDEADELKRELLDGVPTTGPTGSVHRPKVASARKARR